MGGESQEGKEQVAKRKLVGAEYLMCQSNFLEDLEWRRSVTVESETHDPFRYNMHSLQISTYSFRNCP
jgi:hypothetical protein